MGISVIDGIGGSGIGGSGIGGSGISAGQVFNPLSLFANGEQGAWYDPSDLTALYQDSSGTIPVTTDGDPVGLMLDKSGNGIDASQSTTARKPTYDGLAYTIDDFLYVAPHGLSGEFTLIAAVRSTNTGLQTVFGADVGVVGYMIATQQGSTGAVGSGGWGTSFQVSVDGVGFAAPNRGDLYDAICDGAWHVVEATVGALPVDLYLGSSSGPSIFWGGDIGETVVRKEMTEEEKTKARSYLADKYGVTL